MPVTNRSDSRWLYFHGRRYLSSSSMDFPLLSLVLFELVLAWFLCMLTLCSPGRFLLAACLHRQKWVELKLTLAMCTSFSSSPPSRWIMSESGLRSQLLRLLAWHFWPAALAFSPFFVPTSRKILWFLFHMHGFYLFCIFPGLGWHGSDLILVSMLILTRHARKKKRESLKLSRNRNTRASIQQTLLFIIDNNNKIC